MERTTIYLENTIKRSLLEISAEETRRRGKRVGMAEMIREAIIRYLEVKGKSVENHNTKVKRMLSTRGKLGEDFEKKVRGVQKDFKKWKIKSA